MALTTAERLRRLGAGDSIAAVCSAAGVSREEFDAWWTAETRSRVPSTSGQSRAAVQGRVAIRRDQFGIPRITAGSDADLFFGFGFAMAQDRLFQLDYLRRRGHGRLSEILGPSGLELDLTAHTIGLSGIAETEWQALPEESRTLLVAFTAGINAFLDSAGDRLPVEFDLLDYRPEPWRPQDSLVIEGEFRWYLTGRFPVIALPELAKRTLGDGPLYRAYLRAEADDECIMPRGTYRTRKLNSQELPTGGSPNDGSGSNNWVVAGTRTVSGKPLLATDPHIAMQAVSCWYQVVLQGGSFDVAGMAYAGVPAVMFGRNRRVAWGITNNICSLRDLYAEQTDAAHPGSFRYGQEWEPARRRDVQIRVKGAATLTHTVVASRNGPIVDGILPAPLRHLGPVSVRWQGSEPCGWLTSLLNMDRAGTTEEFRQALEPWRVPTFCLVIADVDGHIGFQTTGRTPLRSRVERAFRRGWDPADQWTGYIPTAEMPGLLDPPTGFVATANHRVAEDDYIQPLSGTWASGHRGARIRTMLESQPKHALADFARWQQDAVSVRGQEGLPHLLRELADAPDPRTPEALTYLASWDGRMEPDRVGAALWDLFFAQWSLAIARARFPEATCPLVGGAVGGLALSLLTADDVGWFAEGERKRALHAAFSATLDQLAEKCGPDMLNWNWGRIHLLAQKHVLSDRGDLGKLFDLGGVPVKGDGATVCNTGFDPQWTATMGAGYRHIADLADPAAALHFIDVGSISGHPGSPHYDDQRPLWITGRYHTVTLAGPSSDDGGVFELRP